MQTIPDRFSGLAALPPDRRFVVFDISRPQDRHCRIPACNLPLSTILAPDRPRCTQTRHLARSHGPTRRAEVARSVR
jgi:hypothetical protein